MTTPTTLHEALLGFKSSSLTPLEAQLLMLHALGRESHERAWLLTHGDDVLSPEALERFQGYAQQRVDHVPLSYITGHKEFYGLNLRIDARVLDPRADTETLVDWALSLLKQHPLAVGAKPLEVLDLGTGSGAIALAIKANTSHCSVWAIDSSQDALDVANMNATQLGLELHCFKSHWFEAWSAPSVTNSAPKANLPDLFDLIVSNPPYIAPDDPHLASLMHEPLRALVAQELGMQDLREICTHAKAHLKPGAWLILEHGHDQSQGVQKMLLELGYAHPQSRCDLAGIERCTGAQWLKMK